MLKHILTVAIVAGIAKGSSEDPFRYSGDKNNAPWLNTVHDQIPEDEIAPKGNIVPSSIQGVDFAEIAPPSSSDRDKDEGSSGEAQPLWGTDDLVHSGSILSWGWLSMDHAENGNIYVAVLKRTFDSVEDTVFIYVSYDGGDTWEAFPPIYYPAGDEVYQVELIVGPGTNPWIYTFTRSVNWGQTSTGALVMRRIRADSSAWDWVYIASPGDSLGHFSVDRDLNGNLYLAYLRLLSSGDWRVYRTRSTDEGLTWDSPISVSTGNRDWPEIASGAEDKIYITYEVDDELIRVGAYTNWSSPIFTDIESGDGEEEYQPSVAASRMQPAGSQTAWIIYVNDHNPNKDIHYTYTQDGGQTWMSGSYWPPTNTPHDVWEMHHPHINVSYDYPYDINSVVVSVPSSTWDSLVFAWASSNDPSTWNDRGVYNDYRITSEYGAKIDIVYDAGGSIFVYREYGMGNVWSDYWFNTAVEELGKKRKIVATPYTVKPVKGGALLRFVLPSGKVTTIEVYSSTGRMISSVRKHFDAGFNTYRISLPDPGVYFIKLDDKKAKAVTVE
jgi:hypothetical protein